MQSNDPAGTCGVRAEPAPWHRRRCLLGLAGLAGSAGLGLAGCREAPAPGAAPAPLRLAMDMWPGYYPALLAQELGYFEALKVQISFPANTDRMMADFAAGLYDVMAVALGDLIPTTHARAPVQVFLVSDESAGGDVLLARAGLDIDRSTRLRLGTNLGGFGELFAREFLQRRGVDPARVAWMNSDAAEVPRLLAAGEVDLAHTWEPYATEAEAHGAQRMFSSADTPGLIPDVLAAPRAVIERRAPDLRKFVAGWLKAGEWWHANPEEGARRIAARIVAEPSRVSAKGVRLLGRADNRKLLGADGAATLAPVVARYSAFFLDKGSLGRPVEAADLLRADLLP